MNITVSEILDPNGLVPLVDQGGRHLWYTLPVISAFCPGSGPVPYAKYPPPYLATFLPPTLDPLYDFTQYMGMLQSHNTSAFNPNQVSMVVALDADVLFNAEPTVALESCLFDFSAYVFADGSPISSPPLQFQRVNSTYCDQQALLSLAGTTLSVEAIY